MKTDEIKVGLVCIITSASLYGGTRVKVLQLPSPTTSDFNVEVLDGRHAGAIFRLAPYEVHQAAHQTEQDEEDELDFRRLP